MNWIRHAVAIFLLPCALGSACADSLEDRLNTVWESLWHETGMPTTVMRWEQDIKYRITGVNLSSHRDHAVRTMNAVSQVTGIKVFDISEQPDAAAQANLHIQLVADSELPDHQPCVTHRQAKASVLETVTIKMRTSQAWRCNVHETMHAMGIPGHPSGQTVLSYFPWRRDQLMDMDKLMLKAWYSPRMQAGMTPFEALAVLADEVLASTETDNPKATEVTQQFFAQTLQKMQAYALGQGQVPGVVLRSGKASAHGQDSGALQMAYFVGVAYAKGATVMADRTEAVKWFAIGAQRKHLMSTLALAKAYAIGDGVELDAVQAYAWFSRAESQRRGSGKEEMKALAARLTAEQIEDAQRRLSAMP